MITRMLKSAFIVLFLILFVSFIYIIYFQKDKIYKYEYGGNTNTIQNELEIKNSEPINKETGNSELDNFVSCYKSPISKDEYTIEMNQILDEIYKLFSSSSIKVSFTYEDLYTGLHISYDENSDYFAASVIKSPVVLYIYRMYLNGEINLDEVLVYTSNYYVDGTGSIKNKNFGTKYTIRELIAKTIIESDNIAYTMLCSKISNSNIRDFWKEKGVTTFWYGNNIWARTNPKDGAIYMKELYIFLEEHPELKEEILNYYFNSTTRLINIDNPSIKIAHKSGWTSSSIHDIAIVYGKQPYVLSINSLMGYSNFTNFFYKASNLVNQFHNMYWDKKAEHCYEKIFK